MVSSFRCNLPCRKWQQYFMDFKRYTRHSEGMFCGSFFPSPLAFLYFSSCFLRLIPLFSLLFFLIFSSFHYLSSSSFFPLPFSLFLNNMHKIRNALQLTIDWNCICNPNSNCRLPKNVQAEMKNVLHYAFFKK